MAKSLAVATRFFESKADNKDASLARLKKWVEGGLSVTPAENVIVAINSDADKIDTLDFLKSNYPGVVAIPVTPWGKFVLPLNAIIHYASGKWLDELLMSSAEVVPSAVTLEALRTEMDDDTFVVGARLDGHDFLGNKKTKTKMVERANGRQVPWNTLALYNTERVARVGVPIIGDLPFDPANAGVEELMTLAVAQKIWPKLTAKLVSLPAMSAMWDQSGWDQDRIATHEKKMASKVSRPAVQRELFGFNEQSPLPRVTHVWA